MVFQWFSNGFPSEVNLHGEDVPFGLAVVDLGSSNETFGDLNRRVDDVGLHGTSPY